MQIKGAVPLPSPFLPQLVLICLLHGKFRIKREFLYSGMSRTVYFHFLLCCRQTFGIFSQDLWNIPSLSETAVHIQPLLYFIELATVTQPLHCTTPPGSTSPTLYEQQCGFFYVEQESEQWKSCETGPTVFRPYPRRPKASWLPYIFLAIACILRKRLVHVTGSNIFPDKHLWQILRWQQLRNLYRSYVLQNMLPSWRRSITCKNPSLLASRSALTTASKHSSWLLGSNPATNRKRLISACLGAL